MYIASLRTAEIYFQKARILYAYFERIRGREMSFHGFQIGKYPIQINHSPFQNGADENNQLELIMQKAFTYIKSLIDPIWSPYSKHI